MEGGLFIFFPGGPQVQRYATGKPLELLQLSSTLMTGQTRTNSYQLSSKFELVQS